MFLCNISVQRCDSDTQNVKENVVYNLEATKSTSMIVCQASHLILHNLLNSTLRKL